MCSENARGEAVRSRCCCHWCWHACQSFPKLITWVTGSAQCLFLLPFPQQSDRLSSLLGHRARSICTSQTQGTTLSPASMNVSSERCGPSASCGSSRGAREEGQGCPLKVTPQSCCTPMGRGALSSVLNPPALPGERADT